MCIKKQQSGFPINKMQSIILIAYIQSYLQVIGEVPELNLFTYLA